MAKAAKKVTKAVTKTVKPAAKTTAKAKPAASTGENDTEAVNEYMRKLNHPLKAEIEAVRSIIKHANSSIKERVKWNAPSFFCTADMVTFNPRQLKFVQLVFHHAEIVKIKSALLQGEYKDRRLMHLQNMDEVKAAKKELESIMNELVKRIEK